MDIENELNKLKEIPFSCLSEKVWDRLESTLTEDRSAKTSKLSFLPKYRMLVGSVAVCLIFVLSYSSKMAMTNEVNQYMSSFNQSVHNSNSYYTNSFGSGNFFGD